MHTCFARTQAPSAGHQNARRPRSLTAHRAGVLNAEAGRGPCPVPPARISFSSASKGGGGRELEADDWPAPGIPICCKLTLPQRPCPPSPRWACRSKWPKSVELGSNCWFSGRFFRRADCALWFSAPRQARSVLPAAWAGSRSLSWGGGSSTDSGRIGRILLEPHGGEG